MLLRDPFGLIDNPLPSGRVSNLPKRPQEPKAVLGQLGIVDLFTVDFHQTRPFRRKGYERNSASCKNGCVALVDITRKSEMETLRYLLQVAALEAERLRETSAEALKIIS